MRKLRALLHTLDIVVIGKAIIGRNRGSALSAGRGCDSRGREEMIRQ